MKGIVVVLVLLVFFLSSCDKSLDDKKIDAIITKEKIIDNRVSIESSKEVYSKNDLEKDLSISITNTGNTSIFYNTISDTLVVGFNHYEQDSWKLLRSSSNYLEFARYYKLKELSPGNSVIYRYDAISEIPELKKGLYKITLNYYLENNSSSQPNQVNAFFQIEYTEPKVPESLLKGKVAPWAMNPDGTANFSVIFEEDIPFKRAVYLIAKYHCKYATEIRGITITEKNWGRVLIVTGLPSDVIDLAREPDVEWVEQIHRYASPEDHEPVLIELIQTSYSNWTNLTYGEGRRITIAFKGCEASYYEYRNLKSREERCCYNFTDEYEGRNITLAGCSSPCGPFPEYEKYNAEADIILCLCNQTQDRAYIDAVIFNNGLDLRFRDNDSCQPEKIYVM